MKTQGQKLVCYDFVYPCHAVGGCFRMQRFLLTFLVVFTTIVTPLSAQNSTPASPAPNAKPEAQREEGEEHEAPIVKNSASNIPPDAPVITIQGLCDTQGSATASAKTDCKTVITRSEFEDMANSLQPNMPPQVRKQLANAYPNLLALEKEAQRRGLEKDPHYLERLKFAKLQLLNQELNRQFEEEASKVPEKDMQDYYARNSKNFEQASLQRIYVPRTRQLEPSNSSGNGVDQTTAQRSGEE